VEVVRKELAAANERLAVLAMELATMQAAKGGDRLVACIAGKWEAGEVANGRIVKLGAVGRIMEAPEPGKRNITLAFYAADNPGHWPLSNTKEGTRYDMRRSSFVALDGKPI
jgi:hypothetical protein